jgi:hypothetical protein
MKTRIAGVAVGTTALLALGPLAPASAVNNLKGFGVQETLKNFVSLSDFNSEIGYTVRDLKPSSDIVAFPVAGRLYEANVSTTAVVGTVIPQPNNFRARTADGADYPVLVSVSTLPGGPLGPGGTVSGKLYFDVVGQNPDSVIYNSDFQDMLGWVGPQPVEPPTIMPGTNSTGGSASGGTGGNNGGPGDTGSSGSNQPVPPPDSVAGSSGGGAGGPVGTMPPADNED